MMSASLSNLKATPKAVDGHDEVIIFLSTTIGWLITSPRNRIIVFDATYYSNDR